LFEQEVIGAQNLDNRTTKKSKQKHAELSEAEEFSTMNIALQSVKKGMDSLTGALEERVQNIVGDLIEPLETYQKHYVEECESAVQKSAKFWTSY
jgi:regulator of PEP synthase PpsR (kinase-PPPase family)